MSKLFSLLLAAALVCAACAVPASANEPAKSGGASAASPAGPERGPDVKAPRAGKAKAALLKLMADAKADNSVRVPSPQLPKPERNNLNKAEKIVIGVGIAAAALVITYLIIRANCDGLCEK